MIASWQQQHVGLFATGNPTQLIHSAALACFLQLDCQKSMSKLALGTEGEEMQPGL